MRVRPNANLEVFEADDQDEDGEEYDHCQAQEKSKDGRTKVEGYIKTLD